MREVAAQGGERYLNLDRMHTVPYKHFWIILKKNISYIESLFSFDNVDLSQCKVKESRTRLFFFPLQIPINQFFKFLEFL